MDDVTLNTIIGVNLIFDYKKYESSHPRVARELLREYHSFMRTVTDKKDRAYLKSIMDNYRLDKSC